MRKMITQLEVHGLHILSHEAKFQGFQIEKNHGGCLN